MSKREEKEEDLLKELCGNDAELCDFLKGYLYSDPIAAVSKSDLESLIEEAEKSVKEENYEDAMRKYQRAVDKAIFEATQDPDEKDRYVKVIQDLASNNAKVTVKVKEKVEKDGLADYASSLERKIKNIKFMSERVVDVMKIASLFYNERLERLGARERREERREERRDVEREQQLEDRRADEQREERRKEREKMGKEERKEAEREEKKEEKKEQERREERKVEREEAEREEGRIQEREREKREARTKERRETKTT